MSLPRDSISLKGLPFFAYHGVLPEERARGQRFEAEVQLWLDLAPAGRSDDLTQTVDYSVVYETLRSVVEGEPRALIETVAEHVAERLLAQFPVQQVRVRVTKLAAPLAPGVAGPASVEVVRSRAEQPA